MTVKSLLSCAIVAASISSPLVLAQEDYSNVQVVAEPVASNIFMLKGAGGNIGVLVGEQGVLMIDDQYEPLADKIKAAINKLSVKPLRFLFNTHWHFDHTGGNDQFNAPGVVMIAQQNVRSRMLAGGEIKAFGKTVPAASANALPELTYKDGISLHFAGESIEATAVKSGHTDGDSIVYFKDSNVVHMGDLFFNGVFPFVDLSSGGSVTGLLQALDGALPRMDDKTKVIPGHGALSDKAELQEYRDMVAASITAIKPLKQAGKSLEQVKAMKPMAPLMAQWNGGFIKADVWTSFVYASIE